MIPLTNKEIRSCEKERVYHICKKCFGMVKTRKKVRDHCHHFGKTKGARHSEYNLRYKVPKEIPVLFHNGSTFSFQFHYQILLITYQKFMIKNARHAWKEKILSWIVNLLDLKMVDWIKNAKNAINHILS